MTIKSYPVETQDFTSDQYANTWDGTDGILCDGPSPFGLTLSATDNTATITKSTDPDAVTRARVGGFTGDLLANESIQLPAAVGSAATYILALVCDPADYGDTVHGPITLQRYSGAFNTSGGKSYMPLWKVVRQPSQALNLAEVTDIRQYVSPAIRVGLEAALPNPARYLFTTTCFVAETLHTWMVVFVNGVRTWLNLDDPDWIDFPYASTPGTLIKQFSPVQYRKVRGRVQLRGSVQRSSGRSLVNAGAATVLGTLPAGYRPEVMQPFPVAYSYTHGTDDTATCDNVRLEVAANGVCSLYAHGGGTAWVGFTPATTFPAA